MMITVGELTSPISTETGKRNEKGEELSACDERALRSSPDVPACHTAVLTTAIILYIASLAVSYLMTGSLGLLTTSSSLLASDGCWQCLSCLGSWRRHPSVCLRRHVAVSSVSVCVFSPYKGTTHGVESPACFSIISARFCLQRSISK